MPAWKGRRSSPIAEQPWRQKFNLSEVVSCHLPALCRIAGTRLPPNKKNSREEIMTTPLTFPDRKLGRRTLLKGAAALAATTVTASAAERPLGETGVPT